MRGSNAGQSSTRCAAFTAPGIAFGLVALAAFAHCKRSGAGQGMPTGAAIGPETAAAPPPAPAPPPAGDAALAESLAAADDTPDISADEDCYPSPCPSAELIARACKNVNRFEQAKLDVDAYFDAHVYQPAMKNPAVPQANRAFLQQLRTYREQQRAREQALDRSETGWVPPVASSFVAGVYAEHENFDLSGVGMAIEPETSFDRKAIPVVQIMGIDSVSKARVGAPRPYRAACSTYPTYSLESAALAKVRKPLLATRAAVELEFRSDKRMNEILADANWCQNVRSYCDPIAEHVTFAQLEGVPGLYLTYSEGWFPSRAVAMNIDDEFAVLLWEFSFELIECSCI